MTSDLDRYQPSEQPAGIVGLAPRYRELGRLRMGERVDTGRQKNGKPVMRPAKLDVWRFTSTDWRLIQRAAELYKGEPETWADAPGWNADKQTGVRQFQVTTEANDVPVMLPPEVAFSQSMEAWKAAECLRRCDGTWDQISGAECLCSQEDSPLCKPTTRLSVLLTDMPGLGVWRLETHGWYAARELVPMVRMAATFGAGQRFRLRIDPRQRQTKDAAGKTVTYLFGVPVLDTDLTPGQLLAATPAPEPVVEVARMVDSQVSGERDVRTGNTGRAGEPGSRERTAGSSEGSPATTVHVPQMSEAGGVLSPLDTSASDLTSPSPAGPGKVAGGGDQMVVGSEVHQDPPVHPDVPSLGVPEGDGGTGAVPTPLHDPSPVQAWCTTHGYDIRLARVHLKRTYPDEFGDMRDRLDLDELRPPRSDKAIAYLEAAFLRDDGTTE